MPRSDIVYGSAANPLKFHVGYYTEVAGLGRSPGDVTINGSVDVFNAPFDQPAVPGQQRARPHQPMRTQGRRQQPGQGGQHRSVGPVRRRAGALTPQHRHFVTQNHDLRVFGRLATRQQHQPAEHPDHDQIQQTHRHSPRSCPNLNVRPNCRSTRQRRVLKRYRRSGPVSWLTASSWASRRVCPARPPPDVVAAGPLQVRHVLPGGEPRVGDGDHPAQPPPTPAAWLPASAGGEPGRSSA
jgi:hypothetical protein